MREKDLEKRRSDTFGWWLFGGIFLALGVATFLLTMKEREGAWQLNLQAWIAPAIVGIIGLAFIAAGIYSAIRRT